MPHQCTDCGHVFDDGSKEMLSGCPGCGGNTFQFHPKGTDVPPDPPDAEPPEPEGSSTANTVGRAATKVRDFVSSDDPGAPDSASGPPESPTGTPGRSDTASTGDDGGAASASTTASAADAGSDTGAGPDPNTPWPSERDEGAADLPTDDDGIIDADAREAARAAPDDAETGAAGGPGATGTDSGGPLDGSAPDGPTPAAGSPSAPRGLSAPNASGAADSPASEAPGDGRVASTPDEDQPDISELREQLNDQFESIKILEPGQYELNLMELYDREEYIIALQENGRYVIQVPEQWLGDQPGDA
jgi:predicted  nucleic acid-binding Zn-ribbon protein